MFTLRIECKCGFRSDEALWGLASPFDQQRVAVPVFLPSSGKLLTHWFDSVALGIDSNELDTWISREGFKTIQDVYGAEATMINPAANADMESISCPGCGQFACKIRVVGIT